MHNEAPRSVFGLSEALIVTMLTGLAYCIVFAFDFGMASEVGIPFEYLHVSPEQLIAVAVTLIAVCFPPASAILHSTTISGKLLSSRLALSVTFLLGSAIVLVVLFAVVRFQVDLKQVLILIVGVAIPAGIAGFITTLRQRPRTDECERANRSPQLSPAAVVAFYSLTFAYVAVVCAFGGGVEAASSTESFSIVDGGPFHDHLIVWTDGDLTFLAKWDPKARCYGSEMVVVNVGAGQALRWHRANIGPLASVQSKLSPGESLR